MRRREFLIGLGGTAALRSSDVIAQVSSVPVIGFLNSASPGPFAVFVQAFREGLNEVGFVEGKNVVIESRWAEGRYERLPELAASLIDRHVTLIVATGGMMSARAAKGATATLPVLFLIGMDPVKTGLVASMNRPGGNVTGITMQTTPILDKRLQLLIELVPKAVTIALLVNPNTVDVQVEMDDIERVTTGRGLQFVVLRAASESDFQSAFESAAVMRASGLLVSADPFFTNRRGQLIKLAAQYSLPAAYSWREYVDSGGLMSYGPDIASAYRQIGRHAGRILNGIKPSEMPVELPTKYEFVVNLRTAKTLGIDVAPNTLAIVDSVVENE
jgi:putative tryptophan/tyrosine transport system substrate-binding protein